MPHSICKDPTNFLNDLRGSNLNITELTCNIRNSTSSKSCNDNIGQESDNCWTFSPFTFSKREQVYNRTKNCIGVCDNQIIESNWIIFNITSNILPPAGLFSDYFAVRFNYAFTNDSRPQEMEHRMHLFNKGRIVIFQYDIKIRKRHKSLFTKAYGFAPALINAKADVVIKELQQAENSSYTILIFKPNDAFICIQEETYQYTMGFIISSLGGFYSAIYGIYVLCFGPRRHSPWGLSQNFMCCWDIRREYERKLAKRYVTEADIPLVSPLPMDEPPSKDNDKNFRIIKGRIERLEAMLEECYLDASYFKTLRYVVKQNEEYEKEFAVNKKNEKEGKYIVEKVYRS